VEDSRCVFHSIFVLGGIIVRGVWLRIYNTLGIGIWLVNWWILGSFSAIV